MLKQILTFERVPLAAIKKIVKTERTIGGMQRPKQKSRKKGRRAAIKP